MKKAAAVRHLFKLVATILATGVAQAQVCEVVQTNIPADIANFHAGPNAFQKLGWDSFLGLNAPAPGQAPATGTDAPLWQDWSTIIDMLACVGDGDAPSGCECIDGNCDEPGARYYPTACRGISGYQNYRVLGQLAEIDDSFLQAKTQGLSNDPAIDRNGQFLRYEIMASPVTYRNVVEDRLWDPAVLRSLTEPPVMHCGKASYTGGDPAHPDMGVMTLKVAWMDVTEPPPGLNLNTYHTERLLVHDPAYRNSDGIESCELRDMALVGLHIAHKTAFQPNWIWATFEHRDNAPSCIGGIQGPQPPNMDPKQICPDTVDRDYSLFPRECNGDDPACTACNKSPASNDFDDLCLNPTTPGLEGWCLDQPPASLAGKSRACHQIPVVTPELSVSAPIPDPLPENYPFAAFWNQACVGALTASGLQPWNHYFMISTQWMEPDALPEPADPPICSNAVELVFTDVTNTDAILPQIGLPNGQSRPFLGNTTMESYIRSNCTGCHAKSSIRNDDDEPVNMDMAYFLGLRAQGLASNTMAYDLVAAQGTCTAPLAVPDVDFHMTARIRNQPAVAQEFDLLAAIEIPAGIQAPELLALDTDNPDQAWRVQGRAVEFIADPQCQFVPCEAETQFPSPTGWRWVQFRTTQPVAVGEEDVALESLLRFRFADNTCIQLDGDDYRVWVADDSALRHANLVDGALGSDVFDVFPPGLEFAPIDQPRDPTAIPAVRDLPLYLLALLLLLTGIRLYRN